MSEFAGDVAYQILVTTVALLIILGIYAAIRRH